MLNGTDYIFIAAVLGATAAISVWTISKLNRKQRHRVNRLESAPNREAIKPKRENEEQREDEVERGLESINSRFKIIRILFLILFPLVIFGVLILPALYNWPSTYLSFLFGAITVVIGVAAKPFLENLIAGMVVSFSQPLRLGDTVKFEGHYGTVEKIGLMYSVIKIWDRRRWVIPNNEMIKRDFLNYSMHSLDKWAYVEFTVAPDSNLQQVRGIAVNAAKSSKFNTNFEEPSFWVMNIDKDFIQCWIAAWAANPANAWELKSDIRKNLITEFQNEGVKTHKVNFSFSRASNS